MYYFDYYIKQDNELIPVTICEIKDNKIIVYNNELGYITTDVTKIIFF